MKKTPLQHLRKIFFLISVFILNFFNTACDADPTPKIAIEINPLCVELLPGESQQFNATVFVDEIAQDPNPNNIGVTWAVEGGNVNGTISNAASDAGLYQSPDIENLPDEVVIIATSKEDPQKRTQASVLFSGNCP